MKVRLQVVLYLLLFPVMSMAGTCNSISCFGKIDMLYPHGGNGNIYIQMEGIQLTENTAALNCTLFDGKFIVLKQTNKLHSEIYSMLLSATVANKDLKLRIVEASPDCELIYTTLSGG